MAWLFGSVGRCACGVVAPRRSTFNGEPICGPCAKGRRSARRLTKREVHESVTGLASGPRLTPAQQAAKKRWLKQNALRDRDTRRALADQQDGWSGGDDDNSGAKVALPKEFEHDNERQERIAAEVTFSGHQGLDNPLDNPQPHTTKRYPRTTPCAKQGAAPPPINTIEVEDFWGDDTHKDGVTPHTHVLVRERKRRAEPKPAAVVLKKDKSLADTYREFLFFRKDLSAEQREAIEDEVARLDGTPRRRSVHP